MWVIIYLEDVTFKNTNIVTMEQDKTKRFNMWYAMKLNIKLNRQQNYKQDKTINKVHKLQNDFMLLQLLIGEEFELTSCC